MEKQFVKEPFDKYLQTNALNAHGLMALRRSPFHFYNEYILGNRQAPTPAMITGQILHTAVLEPKLFWERMVIAPTVDKRTTAGKEQLAEFHSSLKPDAIVITDEQADMMIKIVESVHSYDRAANLLREGTAELSGYFTLDGIQCKIRPDFLRGDGVVIDFKTTTDASSRAFQRQIDNYNYHMQAAWYCDGANIILEKKHDYFIFIVVEKTVPYACAVYAADSSVLEKGRMLNRAALDKYKKCVQTCKWPFQVEVENISLPPWAFYEDE